MGRKRDNQRQAVYRWDDKLGAQWPHLIEPMTLKQCVDLVNRVWADHFPQKVPPTVKDGRGCTYAQGGRWRVVLPRWGRRKGTVLHEIAHSLMYGNGHGHYVAAHGPEYARCLLELLVEYGGVERSVAKRLGEQQKPRKVRFAPRDSTAVPKMVSSEYAAWLKERQRLRQALRDHDARRPDPRGGIAAREQR